ncbi:hypothetical protein WJN01_03225 [Flavobacteriaceae bacterium SZ-1-7]|uniref:hypothetical protein n=1 Tax=Tamlana sedimenti TaxID=3134126 RepID=UPI003129874C
MNTFISIMLIIILILIMSDVFFLWKIFKNIGKKKKELPDEKYFELKYNINLLKAVSAILIFIVTFLGFNSYNSISENLEEDFTKKFKIQNDKIDSLGNVISDYEKSVELLKMEEGESVENLADINQKFRIINNKLNQHNESIKYTTKVYVVRDIEFPKRQVGNPVIQEAFMLYFKDLKTIYGEELPVFKSKPMVVIQGKETLLLDIVELTKEYIRIGSVRVSQDNYLDLEDGNATWRVESKSYNFDLWIAEPN